MALAFDLAHSIVPMVLSLSRFLVVIAFLRRLRTVRPAVPVPLSVLHSELFDGVSPPPPFAADLGGGVGALSPAMRAALVPSRDARLPLLLSLGRAVPDLLVLLLALPFATPASGVGENGAGDGCFRRRLSFPDCFRSDPFSTSRRATEAIGSAGLGTAGRGVATGPGAGEAAAATRADDAGESRSG